MLRGARYLDVHNADLADLVENDLPYDDMRAALDVYDYVWRGCRPNDVALLACNDLFFLATQLLHRADLVHPWIYDRAREVEAAPDGYLDLWAREHGKTSLITISATLQEILVDPEITIVIFGHVKQAARKPLAALQYEFQTNELLKWAFPDVCWSNPRREAPRWGLDRGLVVKRKGNPKEATLEAYGLVDGMPTGGHWDILIYDDIVTRESVTNPDMVRKTTEAWELSDNLGSGRVRKRHIGTRYSYGDTWGQILERRLLKPRIYPATDDGTPTGKPVLLSYERWEEKKKTQRSTLNAQMLQNPLAGSDQIFRPEWFDNKYFVRPATLAVYIMGDPSAGRKRDSDRTAIACVGIDPGGTKYLLDGYCHRMSLSQRWDALKMMRRRWLKARGVVLLRIGWEEFGLQADREYFETKMEQGDDAFEIIKLAWPREGPGSKNDRVERLEPDIRTGRFLFPGLVSVTGLGDCYWHMAVNETVKSGMRNQIQTVQCKSPNKQMVNAQKAGRSDYIVKPLRRRDEDGVPYDVTQRLIEELLYFPFAPHDDLCDATSRVYDLDPRGPEINEQEQADDINSLVFPDS